MTNAQLRAWLRKASACEDARMWVGVRDLATAWAECPRGDWLLWISAKQLGQAGWPTRQDVVLAACACAETALRYVPSGEGRPKCAIETARAWARGEATLAQVRSAYAAAYAASAAAAYAASDAASAAYAAASAAAYAAYAAAAAYAASDAAYAASAASAAAYAAASDAASAASAAASAARSQSLAQSADIVRAMLTIPVVQAIQERGE